MTVSWMCPNCEDTVYDVSTDAEDLEYEVPHEFGCENCGCEFEVTEHKPTVIITKKGDAQ